MRYISNGLTVFGKLGTDVDEDGLAFIPIALEPQLNALAASRTLQITLSRRR